jgi:hypothetical protein
MLWEALSAGASLASAVIVLVAAIAAMLQLRHLRLANQLECYLNVTTVMQSPEVIEARRFLESQVFTDPRDFVKSAKLADLIAAAGDGACVAESPER